jgi:hypothetical protein
MKKGERMKAEGGNMMQTILQQGNFLSFIPYPLSLSGFRLAAS